MNKTGAVIISIALMALACAGSAPADDAGDISGETIEEGLDHTVPKFNAIEDFLTFAGPGRTPAQVKFILSSFQGPGTTVHFEEPTFYSMHDEWSWFSLLNGIAIPGYDFGPVSGNSFATVAEIVTWAKGRTSLPFDLTFVAEGSRLYSPRFYTKSFNRTNDQGDTILRFFGCGSVLHFDADSRRQLPGETWAFELEYTDVPTVADVTRFFEVLTEALPPGVGDQMLWLVRSTSQKNIALQIDRQGGPLAHRWTTWESLQVPGDWQTYNPGIAAGIVKIIPAGEVPVVDISKTIAVLREIPDDLPPVAAIITAVPQTPLSHIGILAKARGTPNIYVAAVADDPRFETWSSYRRPIVMQATATGHTFREMSGAEWTHYQSLLTPRQADITPIDVSSLPDTFDPLTATGEQMSSLVPEIGGKTAGFLMLHNYAELDLPDQPLGLTVRGYAEFMATLDPPVAELLAMPDMTDSRVQLTVTEGPDAWLQANGNSDASQKWLAALKLNHAGDAIGKAIDAGGLQKMIMTAPMDAAYLGRITAALSERFAFLAPKQGLRFRSSSSAEDVEGFNGAGLYESHTGYLHPELQSAKKQSKTVEDALRRVWASYWLFNAFQERANAGIDHLAANMGVLVHPVFDDDREAANGVLTLELVRRPDGDLFALTANMQKGALSVTNPPAGSNALPEVDLVRRTGTGTPVVSRIRHSTEVAEGVVLLSDAELISYLDVLSRMASDWLDLRNQPLFMAQRRSTLTLDVEIKRMSPGWPSLADGTTNPERLVIKQGRTIEQPILAPVEFNNMPVPRDILSQTIQITKQTCQSGYLQIDVWEFFTDPSQTWPFDFGTVPFDAHVTFRVKAVIPGFPFAKDDVFQLIHLQAAITHPGQTADSSWRLRVVPLDPADAGFTTLNINASGAWSMNGEADATVSGSDAVCTTTVLMMSPKAFLETLLGG
jgi:hypothetical protein